MIQAAMTLKSLSAQISDDHTAMIGLVTIDTLIILAVMTEPNLAQLNIQTIRRMYSRNRYDRRFGVGVAVLDTVNALCDAVDSLRSEVKELMEALIQMTAEADLI